MSSREKVGNFLCKVALRAAKKKHPPLLVGKNLQPPTLNSQPPISLADRGKKVKVDYIRTLAENTPTRHFSCDLSVASHFTLCSIMLHRIEGPTPLTNNVQKNIWYSRLLGRAHFGPLSA